MEVDDATRREPAMPLSAPLTDARGFVDLYRRESPMLLTFCARRVLDAETALDLTAETFAQAVVSLVVAAVAAVAATTSLLSTGEPLKNPAGVGFSPDRGAGVPVAASVRLSPLRVADPGGARPGACGR